MDIETQRLILRRFKDSDLNDFFEYTSESDVMEISGIKEAKTLGEAKELLDEWKHKGMSLAIELKESGKVIGHISIKEDSEAGLDDVKELGFGLNCNFHRKGYMSEAVKGVLGYLFNNGVNKVYACCYQNNAPSKGLIEKSGFEFEQVGIYISKTLHTEKNTYEYFMAKDKFEA